MKEKEAIFFLFTSQQVMILNDKKNDCDFNHLLDSYTNCINRNCG